MRINDTTLYITDNGAALCGQHLGSTAKHTGRDLSGQEIMAVTPDIAKANAYEGLPGIRCEHPNCGRTPDCEG